MLLCLTVGLVFVVYAWLIVEADSGFYWLHMYKCVDVVLYARNVLYSNAHIITHNNTTRLNTNYEKCLSVMHENLTDEQEKMLEGGKVVSISEHCMAVKVNDIEVFIAPRIEFSNCHCCGDSTKLEVSYNKPQNVDGDPLGLN